MKIIENSNIVNWNIYPEYVCAIVMLSNRDVETIEGFIMPAGEEIIWLLDKAPKIVGDEVEITSTNINCLGGVYLSGDGSADFLDTKELHFKPKPIIQIKQSNHKACEV